MLRQAAPHVSVVYGVAHLLTAARVVLAAAAVDAALTGYVTRAAALITLSAVLDGLDGKVARWLNASGPFGALFDYFCDYLAFLVAPWVLTRTLLGPDRPVFADVVLTLPLLTGAIRYARSSLIVTSRVEEVRELPGLATVFFAFVSVVAVFLDARSRLSPDQFSAVLLIMTALFSVLMVAPIQYPKLSSFRGVPTAVLLLLTTMPVFGTTGIALAALIIGSLYVLVGPLLTHGGRAAHLAGERP
jgi:CDP-diacylglycerol--serine O-phosphatidyltransferase